MEAKWIGRFGLIAAGLALTAAGVGGWLMLGLAEPTAVNRLGSAQAIAAVFLLGLAVVGLILAAFGLWYCFEIGLRRLARSISQGDGLLGLLGVVDGWRDFLSPATSQSVARRIWKWQKGATGRVPKSNRPAWDRIWDDNYVGVKHGSSPEDLAAHQREEWQWRMDRALKFLRAIQKCTDPEIPSPAYLLPHRQVATSGTHEPFSPPSSADAPSLNRVLNALEGVAQAQKKMEADAAALSMFVDLHMTAGELARDASLSLPEDNDFWPGFDIRYNEFLAAFEAAVRMHRAEFSLKSAWALGDVHLNPGEDRKPRAASLKRLQRVQRVLEAIIASRSPSSVDESEFIFGSVRRR